jgi:hypothetical protein
MNSRFKILPELRSTSRSSPGQPSTLLPLPYRTDLTEAGFGLPLLPYHSSRLRNLTNPAISLLPQLASARRSVTMAAWPLLYCLTITDRSPPQTAQRYPATAAATRLTRQS